ncbi:MAG: hypothetical protein NVS9B3_01320 [Gemmatimonadaceae bacterium]
MASWTERPARGNARGARGVGGGVGVAVVFARWATAAGAQDGIFERLGLDRLRLTSLGGGVGVVWPTQVESTRAFSLYADYGEIIPRWRVVFTATYWGSHLTDDVVQTFTDSLRRRALIDPAGRATIEPSRVSVSDIAIGGDMRWSPPWSPLFRPYLGGGLTAHVLNAQGKLIDGTFVERALDTIAAGFCGIAGAQTTIARHLVLDVQTRYDLVSAVRYGSIRIGASYLFDAERREGAP